MTSIIPTPVTKSSKSQVVLIPWDTTSAEHIQHLVQQRIACGWDYEDEHIERWKTAQESGNLNLQWVVLDDSNPETNAKLLKHTEAYPQGQKPLLDSAVYFGGKSRTIPLPQRTFIPIGHISLGPVPPRYEASGIVQSEKGMYWISNFYVSRALQGSGLGSAVLDTIEKLATDEPLCARVLAMNAINKDDPDREEKYKALKLTIPPFSNHEWYARRGYQVFNNVEKEFSKVDSTGKAWYWNAVFLKKEL